MDKHAEFLKAYTPRAEFQCDGSTTHYQGCKCHESRWQAQLEAVTRERDGLSENLYVANLAAVQAAKERDALKAALEEATAELIYLRLYGKDGALWSLNECKDVWREKARAALERMGARKGEGKP
jgi:uncharacterized coiled-coil DUF342 family protein